MTPSESPLARRDDAATRQVNDRTLREQLRRRPELLARMTEGAQRPVLIRIAEALGLVRSEEL